MEKILEVENLNVSFHTYAGEVKAVRGIDFEKAYGDIGKGFIHVHHLIPLHSIGKEYVVDYKKDLIPVCPNCHSMIHRLEGGEEMTVEEIKSKLTGSDF